MRKPRTNIKKMKRIASILDADRSKPFDLAIPNTYKDGKTTVTVLRNAKVLGMHFSNTTPAVGYSFTIKPFDV